MSQILMLILSLEGGANWFLGDLQREINTGPYIAAGVEYGLSNYTALYLQGSFSYLSLKNNPDFHGLYQFLGRAGIEIPSNHFAIGMGVSMATVRGNNALEQAQEYMLATSESEFGWHVRLEWSALKFEKFKAGARLYYDKIWTKPKNSSLAQGGLFASYLM